MSGPGSCRDCHARIWWGTNPDGSGRPFPYDDPTGLTPHFSTCSAVARVRNPWTGEEVRVSRCIHCKLPIWWRTTHRGAKQPMNLAPDNSASQQTHFETCSGSPSRRAWTGQEWVEPDPVFHPSAAPAWQTELQPHLRVLGLSWPCSKDDARSAYRRLAHQRHPDRGGSQTAFVALKEAYDAATLLLEAAPMP